MRLRRLTRGAGERLDDAPPSTVDAMGRSEFSLIAALREQLPGVGERVVVGSGDDAAVVRAGGSHSVVSVDTTVDGVHARLDLGDPVASAHDFGWRALTTALSDLAAMGVGDEPGNTEAYVALTLPADFDDARAVAIAAGIGEAATQFGTSVVGGDVTSGPVVVASVTVVGWAEQARTELAGAEGALTEPAGVLTRAGARAGDLLGLAGPLGEAAAGLALRTGELDADALPSPDVRRLLEAYGRPTPQLAKGAALRRAGATAAIDLSDGLLQDAGHIASASGVTLRLDSASVPVAPAVHAAALQLGEEPWRFAATGGEDFVLLVAVPPERRAEAERAGVTTWVGDVAAGPPRVTVDGDEVSSDAQRGFDHRR